MGQREEAHILNPCGSTRLLSIYEVFVLLAGITEVMNMKNLKGHFDLKGLKDFHGYNENSIK